MKILEKSFRSKGFFHEQIFRENEYAIYKRTRCTKNACEPHWELIIIKEHEEYKLGPAIIPAGESYAPTSMWGILGWTLGSKEAAFSKLKIVQEHQKQLELAAKKRKK